MSYTNTLITVSPDCPVAHSEVPQSKRALVPEHIRQYELLKQKPYGYDHYELIFRSYLQKEGIDPRLAPDEKKALWNKLFSKGHPCLRASALTKRYGYGAHYNEEGKIALYPIESAEYKALMEDEKITKIPAMRSKR